MSKEVPSRLLFFAVAAVSLTLALLPHPPALPLDRLGDKAEHMLAFAVMTWLACWGFRGVADRLVLERLAFFGAMIEVLQSIPALHRDCDIRDWVADVLAVIAVLALRRAYWAAARIMVPNRA